MKKLLVYGDSLSNGNHGDHAYYGALEKMGLDVTNRAFGSSGLCANTPSSMMQQLETYVDKDYDVVLCWHGTNDWYWGSDIDRFHSSIIEAISIIRERNPKALILWCGPLYRYEAPDGSQNKGNAFFTGNKRGLTLLDYRQVLVDVLSSLGVFYMDMNELVQIHSGNAAELLADNVHPNAKGYERIGRVLSEALSRLFYIKDGKRL